MNVSDPSAWMDNNNDLLSDLSRFSHQKEVPGRFRLCFTDGGDFSALSVWSTDGKRCLGHIDGEELVLFLTRALCRLNHRTPARVSGDLAAVSAG